MPIVHKPTDRNYRLDRLINREGTLDRTQKLGHMCIKQSKLNPKFAEKASRECKELKHGGGGWGMRKRER